MKELSNKDFYKIFYDGFEKFINNDIEENELIKEIMWKDDNMTKEEISSKIEDVFNWLIRQDDRCFGCGKILNDEDYIIKGEPRPYGESYVDEMICSGYECNKCGHREDY